MFKYLRANSMVPTAVNAAVVLGIVTATIAQPSSAPAVADSTAVSQPSETIAHPSETLSTSKVHAVPLQVRLDAQGRMFIDSQAATPADLADELERLQQRTTDSPAVRIVVDSACPAHIREMTIQLLRNSGMKSQQWSMDEQPIGPAPIPHDPQAMKAWLHRKLVKTDGPATTTTSHPQVADDWPTRMARLRERFDTARDYADHLIDDLRKFFASPAENR